MSLFAKHTFFQNKLINMYAKCDSLVDVRKVFEKMTERDVFSWNVMIGAYQKHERPHEALTIFHKMQQTSVHPDHFTFATILPACSKIGALKMGMDIHQGIMEMGFFSDVVVASALLDMYVKCGSIHQAREVFDNMPERNVVSWNTMIAGYAQHGYVEKVLETFKQMQFTGLKPNSSTYASILRVCAKIGALDQGMEFHKRIFESGFLGDVLVANALIDMYAKCGSIRKAAELFEKMPHRDTVSWNVMITGYAKNGYVGETLRLFKEMPQRNVVSWTALIGGYAQNGIAEKALEAFKQMQLAGIKPNSTTFPSVLPACAQIGSLEKGMHIHESIIESGFFSDVVVASALIDMYVKCGNMQKARAVFDKMPERNAISWTMMIAGYAKHGALEEAINIFKEMPHRDMVSWSTMIAGFAQNGLVEKAIETYKQMQLAGLKPDSTTFATLLPACAKTGALKWGLDIHQSVIENGFRLDIVVASALIDMYAKCGCIQKAWEVFDKMPQRNVISWTAMIAGYAQSGLVENALETFKRMQLAGVKPDSASFASTLPACGKMGALEQGMEFHQRIIKSNFLSDTLVANALIDMYAKCGRIQKTRKLFDKMLERDTVSWNAMIAGYAMHGYGKDALELFELMKHSGVHPDHVSYVCVLFACSHSSLLEEGCKYFNGMSDFYCIKPIIDHYVCIVDLLGRASYLDKALNFIIKMPIKPAVVVWKCLLGACRSHNNIGLGVFTATLFLELDPKNAAPYVLLSDIYAEVGRWGDVQKIRRLMKDEGIKKIPGCSWIEVHKMVHVFCAGDRSHPQKEEIYAMLEKLSWEMKAAGYFPESRHVLNDVEKEEKEFFLCHHSEKLAIACGLLNTSPGMIIGVVKNLRVCIECHTATKFISKITSREIVVRDANRFHHFSQGQCSCGDYW
ncbi:pentatricopeptide repeat-containing protein At4g21065 [Cryptomeria japonica]|uniref:pentatricopeptide repeat-containing protein At4g21065 n=1 Tax=Cryptomeria japonica TaxID=3369 RepID=UPI0027D9FADB|nr:pentatricopeptide repeat-containing protein At4g21065 [Cryptomeria japonica]XP_057873561.2 pentatricopeptide repeat-containing protein At4g21065 [Cryptomeria japonica]